MPWNLGSFGCGNRILRTGMPLCLMFAIVASVAIRRISRLTSDCASTGQTAFTPTGCPCKLEGLKCRDSNVYCNNGICSKRPNMTDLTVESCVACSTVGFNIYLSEPVIIAGCDLSFYSGTGVYIRSVCAFQPLKECLFYVDYAFGNSSADFIGGPGDTYQAGTYGTCAFTGTAASTTTCDTDGVINLNKQFDNVLTSPYFGVDTDTQEILLKPQILLFNPPLADPYFFVPSPDEPDGVIVQYYVVRCIDQSDQTSPFVSFRATLPYCSIGQVVEDDSASGDDSAPGDDSAAGDDADTATDYDDSSRSLKPRKLDSGKSKPRKSKPKKRHAAG